MYSNANKMVLIKIHISNHSFFNPFTDLNELIPDFVNENEIINLIW